MDSRTIDGKHLKKSCTITFEEFVKAQSEVLADFAHYAAAEPGGAEAIFPLMMIFPAIMAKIAHKLFDETEPAMDEAQDADRVS